MKMNYSQLREMNSERRRQNEKQKKWRAHTHTHTIYAALKMKLT